MLGKVSILVHRCRNFDFPSSILAKLHKFWNWTRIEIHSETAFLNSTNSVSAARNTKVVLTIYEVCAGIL